MSTDSTDSKGRESEINIANLEVTIYDLHRTQLTSCRRLNG